MTYPHLTATYAGLFAVIFAAMSVWVITGRFTYKVNLGDGGKDTMTTRIRAHGNFAEYVPLILLLVALLEMAHTSRFVVHGLLIALLVARIVHPLGIIARPNSSRHMSLRAGGTIATLLVLAISGILLLLKPLA